MDFAIGLLLFTVTLVVYFSYTNNFQKQEKGDLDDMMSDAKAVSSSLSLSGYPYGWNNSTVARIGLADEQNVNATKWKSFKQINYSSTKRKLATNYEYFAFFVNDNDEVLNINGVCGVGYPLINTTYSVKSAYYYKSESLLRDFMTQTFNADIYFDDDNGDIYGMDGLISNLSKYSFIVIEDPGFNTGDFQGKYKTPLNNYSSSGGLTIVSGQLVAGQNKELFGVEFSKDRGSSESYRNATVNASDQYLSLNVGSKITFVQAYDVENDTSSPLPALELTTIASFDNDNNNAIAKWKYGNGTVYFFSDFDVSYFNGNFINSIEEAAKGFVEGVCSPVNATIASPKKLVRTERYLSYDSKIVRMVLYVWQ